jgi:hypothetical protein
MQQPQQSTMGARNLENLMDLMNHEAVSYKKAKTFSSQIMDPNANASWTTSARITSSASTRSTISEQSHLKERNHATEPIHGRANHLKGFAGRRKAAHEHLLHAAWRNILREYAHDASGPFDRSRGRQFALFQILQQKGWYPTKKRSKARSIRPSSRRSK